MKPVLIIACGAAKRPGRHLVSDLYTGPFWSSYRRAMRETVPGWEPGDENPLATVYVLSAEHGLVPEGTKLDNYEHRLVKGEVEVLADVVREQLDSGATRFASVPGAVTFVGSKLYAQVLRGAGLVVDELAPSQGIGWKRKGLGDWIRGFRSSSDLDAIITRVLGR